MGSPGRTNCPRTIKANTSAFCCTSAPANDIGAVVPAVGHGSGPRGIPSRAISIIDSTRSSGKFSGLMGETARTSTSEGRPMTVAIRAAKRTLAPVCTPGPWTGLVVWGRVCRTSPATLQPKWNWWFLEGIRSCRSGSFHKVPGCHCQRTGPSLLAYGCSCKSWRRC